MAVWGAVIVAAGKGRRMGKKENKQYLSIGGKPILALTLERFSLMTKVRHLIVVVGSEDVERVARYPMQYPDIRSDLKVLAGGSERQSSVYAGLRALPEETDYVLVHDGVRPFTQLPHIEACMDQAEKTGAAVLAVPVKDTIKMVGPEGVVQSTPDRKRLWAIQTPQAFRFDWLQQAHRQAEEDKFLGTDDAMLMERSGMPVHVVQGDGTNIKITTPDDLDWAQWLLSKKEGERD